MNISVSTPKGKDTAVYTYRHVLNNEGVYQPIGHKEIRVVSLENVEGKNTLLYIDTDNDYIEELSEEAWEDDEFIYVPEPVTITFVNPE